VNCHGCSGTYDVKGTTVTIHPIIGKDPGAAGSLMTFDSKIEKTNLMLTLKPPQTAPSGMSYTVKFIRLEEGRSVGAAENGLQIPSGSR
jgi:hypothetical protein